LYWEIFAALRGPHHFPAVGALCDHEVDKDLFLQGLLE